MVNPQTVTYVETYAVACPHCSEELRLTISRERGGRVTDLELIELPSTPKTESVAP